MPFLERPIIPIIDDYDLWSWGAPLALDLLLILLMLVQNSFPRKKRNINK